MNDTQKKYMAILTEDELKALRKVLNWYIDGIPLEMPLNEYGQLCRAQKDIDEARELKPRPSGWGEIVRQQVLGDPKKK